MTSYTNPAYTKFEHDFKKFEQTAKNYSAAVTAHGNAQTACHNALTSSIFDLNSGSKFHSVESAYMALMIILATSGSDQLSSTLGVSGESLHIIGRITTCGNDLQNITHSTETGANGAIDVHEEAVGLDQMLNALGGSTSKAWYTDVKDALSGNGSGGTTESGLFQEFDVVRGDIYDGSDAGSDGSDNPKGYNPQQVTTTPTNPPPYFFDVNDPNNPAAGDFLGSFGEMQANMGSQGDLKSANEASDSMLNAFNTNTSTTQSANAAANEQITQESNTIKTLTSFLTDMTHSTQDTSKSAINNMSR